MSVPGDIDLPFCPGLDDVSGPAADNATAIGGAIQTGTILNDSVTGTLFADLSISSTDATYYGITYRLNKSGSAPTSNAQYLANARIGCANGGIPNTLAGVAVIVSTSPSDIGSVSIVGKVSTVWAQAATVMTGMVQVTSANTWDSGSFAYAEYLDVDSGLPTVPVGNISIVIGGQLVGQIFGSNSESGGFNNCCALFQMALATLKNTTISSLTRIVPPASGIGSFVYNTNFSGSDLSIMVPGGNFVDTDYIGICVLFFIPGGMPQPLAGQLNAAIALLGDPQTP